MNMKGNTYNTTTGATAIIAQAQAQARQGNLPLAVAILTQYISQQPESNTEEAHRLRGELLLKMGDKKGAEQDAIAVLRINPSLAEGKHEAEGKE